jgi:Kdo2-lipid IVA lauroyltransferase/acyltransferase
MTDGLRLRLYYRLAGALAWLAYRALGLRRSIVRGNLQRSFPEWSAAEQRSARREFARRQGELAAEVFYAEHIDEAELRARVTLANPQAVAAAAPPRPLILVGAHHGNFEWMLLRVSLEFGDRLIGLYKPLRQPRIDGRMKAMRSRFGARLVPAKSILRELANFREAAAIGMVADQVPRTSPEKQWVTFLGQDTAFFMGPELLGRALRSQVVLVKMRRRARGRYELEFEALNEPGEKLPSGEITSRYARGLEAWIREDPPGWWWSHRRWKLKRERAEAAGDM